MPLCAVCKTLKPSQCYVALYLHSLYDYMIFEASFFKIYKQHFFLIKSLFLTNAVSDRF